ncbi:MAG: DUF4838 domain-containing protein [Lentisphaerae bacterium]|nr:DUF4838 domain-containing protein [Lentisphaerota bacterium]
MFKKLQLCLLLTAAVNMLPVNAAELVLAQNKTAAAVIVTPENCGKVVEFAARELKQFLDEATGADFRIVKAAEDGENAIVLGDCSAAQKAGIEVKTLKRDGFRLLRQGNRIFIAGRDDKNYDLDAFVKMQKVPPHNGRGWFNHASKPEYATLFGVYDFLERTAGVRFYYPGKLGTYVPKLDKLSVDKLDVINEPAMIFRFTMGLGDRSHGKYRVWRMADYPEIGVSREDSNYYSLRCRQSTLYVPQNHAEGMLRWHKRFWEKPENRRAELFALKADGSRYAESQHKFSLCYSNEAVVRQMAEDACVFFAGLPATKMKNAPWNAKWVEDRAQGDYFSIQPNDFYGSGCMCSKCTALANKNFSSGQNADLPGEFVANPAEYSKVMWDYYRNVAEAVGKKYPGKYLTTLAYGKWRLPYENMTELPDNLLVGVTTIPNGSSNDHPAMKIIFNEIAKWSKLTDSGIWLWHYQINRPQYDGIPQPRLWAAGRFYNELAQYKLVGIFMETEITHGFQHHLDIYLNCRLMWDPAADADSMIKEYARNMYGEAANEVLKLLHIFEDCYLKGIVRKEAAGISGAAYRDVVDWPEGRWPGEGMKGLRREVYNDAVIDEIIKLSKQAKSKAAADSVEGQRLKLFTGRMVGELLKKLNINREY